MLDVERADYMFQPGRFGTLEVGPFAFHVNTADGGSVGFAVKVGRWEWDWMLLRGPHILDKPPVSGASDE